MPVVAPPDDASGGQVLTDVAQATPVWLTEVLRRSGTLGHGRVESVEIVSRPTPQAAMAVRYAGAVDTEAPRALRLKLAPADANALPSAEVASYQMITP